jgi:cold shock CspA family protein
MEANDRIYKGTISFFDERKRFGFIRDSMSSKEIFFHHSGLKINGTDCLKGMNVEYELSTWRNKTVAVNVKLIE